MRPDRDTRTRGLVSLGQLGLSVVYPYTLGRGFNR